MCCKELPPNRGCRFQSASDPATHHLSGLWLIIKKLIVMPSSFTFSCSFSFFFIRMNKYIENTREKVFSWSRYRILCRFDCFKMICLFTKINLWFLSKASGVFFLFAYGKVFYVI